MVQAVPDADVSTLLPLAGGLVTGSLVVFGVARDKVKDLLGLRYDRVKEPSQRSRLAGARRVCALSVVLALAAAAILLPGTVAIARAAVEPPRTWSTVKAAYLFAQLVLLAVAGLAWHERIRALASQDSWQRERGAVLND